MIKYIKKLWVRPSPVFIANRWFTLHHEPTDKDHIMIYLNGAIIDPSEYKLNGTEIEWISKDIILLTSDDLRAQYFYLEKDHEVGCINGFVLHPHPGYSRYELRRQK